MIAAVASRMTSAYLLRRGSCVDNTFVYPGDSGFSADYHRQSANSDLLNFRFWRSMPVGLQGKGKYCRS